MTQRRLAGMHVRDAVGVLRARVVSTHCQLTLPERAAEWLLSEWREVEAEPTGYWLSTLTENSSFAPMVDLIELRWRIERDYQDLKQDLGLDHFKGRS